MVKSLSLSELAFLSCQTRKSLLSFLPFLWMEIKTEKSAVAYAKAENQSLMDAVNIRKWLK